MEKKWWQSSVVYQIYPRSFADSNGDGMGDIPGITGKIEYLKKLGVNVLWICPIYQSPQDDNGYDISDYRTVYPEFGTMVRMGEMLEYTYVNGNAYGTTKKSVEEARAKGKNVILDVDTIGAMKIRALCPDATLIYILPPSWDELKSRLSSTGIYTEEEVNALMEIAEEEISCANSYDYILVNDTISNTLSRFAQIIHSNRYSRNCMKEFLDSYIDGEVKPHVQSYKEALL